MTTPRPVRPRPEQSAPAAPARDVAPGRDEPGLSPLLAVAIVLGLSAVGGVLDLAMGNGLSLLHGIGHVVGCLVAAALIRRRYLPVAVLAPPLLYAGTALAAAVVSADALTVSVLGYEVFIRLILGAPVLLGGAALALLVLLARRALRR